MYERLIEIVHGEVANGCPMGAAIMKVANSNMVPISKLAGEMRKHAHARTEAKKAAQRYRATVPNRMITHLVER
jgi:hypothetical protein